MDILLGVGLETWDIFREAAPYVLLGFVAAGLLKAVLPDSLVARHLGSNSTGSVIKASLLGIPLPLCSCGVIPAAIGLRRQGASKGASAAFLVSTPESGVDSIAITYALLDPIMTIIRPVAAFITATVTGLMISRLPDEKNEVGESICGCGGESATMVEAASGSFAGRARQGLTFAFGELLRDIGSWLLLGIVLAGLISYFVPDDFFARFLGSEFSSLLIMLVVGIPLYICASASTPIAAALILKGVSPGAALVFLLAGPATNAATVTVVGRFWGKRTTVVYLAVIAVCSLLIGWLTNRLYAALDIDLSQLIATGAHDGPAGWSTAAAVVLLVLILRAWFNGLRSSSADSCCD